MDEYRIYFGVGGGHIKFKYGQVGGSWRLFTPEALFSRRPHLGWFVSTILAKGLTVCSEKNKEPARFEARI